MRTFSIIIFLTSLIAMTFSGPLICLEYNLNKGYIASRLCENIEKPQLKCKGKCQLNKTLKEAEKKTNQPAQNIKSTLQVTLFNQENGFEVTKQELPGNTPFSRNPNLFSRLVVQSIFHPPSAAA